MLCSLKEYVNKLNYMHCPAKDIVTCIYKIKINIVVTFFSLLYFLLSRGEESNSHFVSGSSDSFLLPLLFCTFFLLKLVQLQLTAVGSWTFVRQHEKRDDYISFPSRCFETADKSPPWPF